MINAPASPHRVPARAPQGELRPLPQVRNVIAVGSGKGGVGKSTVAVNLALALAAEGAAVGVLDADIYGPSVPMMLGLSGRPDSPDGKSIEPMRAHGLQAMSIGLLVDQDTPMIWRGPMATSALAQLLTDTRWGDLDVLVVDLPPGTGDIQLTMAQKIPVAGAVVVTTPQDVATLDARKALKMFEKLDIAVLGLSGRPDSPDGKAIEPMRAHGIEAMSIGLLVDQDAPMIWRGPMATSALTQLLTDTRWGDLDVLVVDLPPGTGDIQLTMAQKIPVAGAVIVTTPQDIATLDARKALKMFEKLDIAVLGLVENMAVHVCSNCGHAEHIFGEGGAGRMSEQYGVPVLGSLPLQVAIREQGDAGTPIVAAQADSAMAQAYRDVARAMLARLDQRPKLRSGIMASLLGG